MLLLNPEELREGDVLLLNQVELILNYNTPSIPPLVVINDGNIQFFSWFFENRYVRGGYTEFCRLPANTKEISKFHLFGKVHIIAIKRFDKTEEIKEYFKDRPAFKDIKWDWEMRYDNRYSMFDTVKKDMQHYWEDDSPCW